MNMAMTTGKTYRHTLSAFMRECGYDVAEDMPVGEKIDGNIMKAQCVINPNRKRRTLVFVRTQTVRGSAENRVPFDVINIADNMKAGEKAYLVLSGKGWQLEKKKFFVERLAKIMGAKIKIVSEADFRMSAVRKAV